jgi:hypothetical protein
MPYDPAIPHLRMYPKEYKSAYNKGTWTPMFILINIQIWCHLTIMTTEMAFYPLLRDEESRVHKDCAYCKKLNSKCRKLEWIDSFRLQNLSSS